MNHIHDVSKRSDAYSQKSERKGLSGMFENILRKLGPLFHMLMMLPLYMVGCVAVGLALAPGILFFRWVFQFVSDQPLIIKVCALSPAIAASYLMYGFTAIFVMPAFNFVTRSKLSAWRGPYYSLPAIRWYIHNGATYLVRYTFLEFITPTPFSLLFYRMMGMKIGEGTVINTTHLSDPSLIELGRKVTLGGSVVIVGHYGQGGYLVLAPVKIGDRATIGLRAVIMGGTTIGNEAKILPNSVVLPKTTIPDGETWGGVPAKKIDVQELKDLLKAA